MKLGFVGLGQIGRPMAERLEAPVVFDVRDDATQGFSDVAASAREVAERADVVSVMVVDDTQVREVVGEMLPAATPGTVIAIHSTISPKTAEDLAARSGGACVVDAPVSGGPMGAGQGSLAVMVGGPLDAFEQCREAFSPWASLVVHAGKVGDGTRMKLARNLITMASFTAAAEAQRLAEAAGLDLVELGNVVRHSDKVTGGPGAIMFRNTASPAQPGDPWLDVLVHTRELGEKDLSLVIDLGRELGVDLPVAELALQQLAAGLGVPHD